jgi:predicted GTPase
MGAAGSVQESDSSKAEASRKLLEEFRVAVIEAAASLAPSAGVACDENECNLANPGNKSDKRLKSVFDQFDTNHDGVLDRNELDNLIQRLDFHVSDQLKSELRSNMKNLLLSFADPSFHLVFNEFYQFIKPAPAGEGCGICPKDCKCANCRKLVLKEPKRIVFVGATGSGKSSLCTALTGQDKAGTSFKIGNKASSETSEVKMERYHWFGEDREEEFLCIDTPGLDDELGRDNEYINNIIQEMQKLEYVNAIILVVNGQNPRFSTSLQNMISQFEKAFSSRFYEHSIICLTRWYQDEDSRAEREEDGRTEEKVTEDLTSKINSSKALGCRRKLPVVFVDSFYQRKDPKHGKQRLNKLREFVGNNVFRTGDLATLKPRISELTNTFQVMRSSQPISMMQPVLFDDSVKVEEWEVKPELPGGLRIDPSKGTILGSPSKVLARTTFVLRARSIGGWSESYPFDIEIGHSDIEMKSLILLAMKSISTALEELLPVDSNEPFDESEVKAKINKARAIGSDSFKSKVEELKANYGDIITFKEMIELFRLEYDRKEIQLENEFLSVNQKMFDQAREREKVENDLKIQLLRETTNMMALKGLINTAETVGGIDKELLEKAKKWLDDITPSSCCFSGNGCLVKLMKRERTVHESFCVYGLPTYRKTDVARVKATNGKAGVMISLKDGKNKEEKFLNCIGKYQFDDDSNSYYFLNFDKRLIYCLRSEKKGAYTAASPTAVTWVVTSTDHPQSPDTVIATSSNKCDDPVKAEFKAFNIEPNETYQWKDVMVEKHPKSDSLLLMYFGGKWCPYCP